MPSCRGPGFLRYEVLRGFLKLELCCFGFTELRHTLAKWFGFLQRLHSFPFAGQGHSLCGNVPPQFLHGLVLKLSFFWRGRMWCVCASECPVDWLIQFPTTDMYWFRHGPRPQACLLRYISGLLKPVYGFWRTYHPPEVVVRFRSPDCLLQIHNFGQVFVSEYGIGPTILLDFVWFGGTCKLHTGGARGKFVSGAKVLAAVPSISQPESFISTFSHWVTVWNDPHSLNSFHNQFQWDLN